MHPLKPAASSTASTSRPTALCRSDDQPTLFQTPVAKKQKTGAKERRTSLSSDDSIEILMPKPRKMRLRMATRLEMVADGHRDPGPCMEVEPPASGANKSTPPPPPTPTPQILQGFSLPGPVRPAPLGIMMPPASFISRYAPYMEPFTSFGPFMADNGLVSYSVFSDATGRAYVQMTASIQDMQAVHRDMYLRQQHHQTHAEQAHGANARSGV